MRFRYHPLARRELLAAAKYYENERAGLGERFLNGVRDGITSVTAEPLAWPVIRGRIRKRTLTSRFPFSIIYAVIDGKILIVAVAHQSRREDYWKSRINFD